MFNLDDYISDLEHTSADILEAYMDEKYKHNKEIKRLISLEIIKHLDLAASSIETKLDYVKESNEISNFDLDDFIFELSCNIESAICLYFEAITCQNKETIENMLRIEMLKAIETTREKLEKLKTQREYYENGNVMYEITNGA